MSRKKAGDIVRSGDKYRQVRIVREDEVAKKKDEPHYQRINLNAGDIVDPSRYNSAFCCRSPITEPARVLEVKHDDDNPYYTQVLLACESGTAWLGQNWLEWEGKKKV